MASWSKTTKHEPNEINKGNQYTRDNVVPIEQLNAITENSFYAVDKSEEALVKANSAFEANGTLVTIGGESQPTWSADFAEAERQKSKNLCFLKNVTQSKNGITISFDSEEQTITINGTATSSSDFMQGTRNILPTISNANGKNFIVSYKYISGTADNFGMYIGSKDVGIYEDRHIIKPAGWDIKENPSISVAITTNNVYDTLMFYIPNGAIINNLTFKIQIEEGLTATEWQYPHGEIVHEKDIQNHIITAKLTSDFYFEQVETVETIPVEYNYGVGNKLTMANNSIVVGKGVSKVKISACVIYKGASTSFNAYIYHNTTSVNFQYHNPQSTDGDAMVFTDFIIPVSQGDTITLKGLVYSASMIVVGSTVHRTYLTVEVIE